MADENHLMEPTQVHSPTQHTHVLLAIDSIQRSHRFVSEQRFVANALTLPHVVDGDVEVDGFVLGWEHTVKYVNVRPNGIRDKPLKTLRDVRRSSGLRRGGNHLRERIVRAWGTSLHVKR